MKQINAFLVCSCTILFFMSCNSSDRTPDYASGKADTAVIAAALTDEGTAGGEIPSITPPDADLWVGVAARWKVSEGEIYNGQYDSILFYFKHCGQNKPLPVPRDQVEFETVPNCDTDDGPSISLIQKGVDGLPPTLVAVDDIDQGKAIIVRNGRTDSVRLSPAAIERMRTSVPPEMIRNQKKVMMKNRAPE